MLVTARYSSLPGGEIIQTEARDLRVVSMQVILENLNERVPEEQESTEKRGEPGQD